MNIPLRKSILALGAVFGLGLAGASAASAHEFYDGGWHDHDWHGRYEYHDWNRFHHDRYDHGWNYEHRYSDYHDGYGRHGWNTDYRDGYGRDGWHRNRDADYSYSDYR